MNAKAALAKALLDGRTLNIKNCFETIGLSNCPREISRMIEKPFNVSVRRSRREGLSRYETTITWMDYKLFNTPENAEGIIAMKKYVNKHLSELNPKTDRQVKELRKSGINNIPKLDPPPNPLFQ